MFYVIGLGNPGEKYANTRHNIGWLALDYVRGQNSFSELVDSRQYSGRVAEGGVAGRPATVLYPDTFMNNSGSAVVKMVPRDEIDNLIVVHDDIALPFGEVRLGKGRGDGGHNGIKSIIEKLGSKDFVRIRIGIAPTGLFTGKVKRPAGGGPLERFVLKRLSSKEVNKLEDTYLKVDEALSVIVKEGVEMAMNRFN
ncbi:aminoacyl-tRNA hydrolase [Candidatus Nomurabacteria bacterium]|nr:aminoacyl-tRNA hydrolase [Candidatus Nomurabacteria bacterium]